MRIGLGFFCSTSDNELSTNHTVRLRSLNEGAVLAALELNFRDLMELLDMSRRMGLTIFRLGSKFVPFASHPLFKSEWRERIGRALRGRASEVKGYGIRITMHPGQYVVLNSRRGDVLDRSLAELRYHFWLLDSLSVGEDGVVVVHIGGVYGDKKKSLERLEEVLEEHRWLTERLALENDERNYAASEVVEIAESLDVPAVFDYYHHKLNPSKFCADRLIATWKGIVPEVHLSSAPRGPHRFGEHGDYVEAKDFKELVSLFGGADAIDVVVEAKKKEKAIAKLVEDLRREGYKWGDGE